MGWDDLKSRPKGASLEMSVRECRRRVAEAKVLLELVRQGHWKGDDAMLLVDMSARLDFEVRRLEAEMEAMKW